MQIRYFHELCARVKIAYPTHPRILEHKVQVLKEHCKTVGRDFEEITLSTLIQPRLREEWERIPVLARISVSYYGMSESEAREIVEMMMGTENISESVKRCHDICIRLFTLSQVKTAQLETFKKEVIMKL